jgi:hypothetical protein
MYYCYFKRVYPAHKVQKVIVVLMEHLAVLVKVSFVLLKYNKIEFLFFVQLVVMVSKEVEEIMDDQVRYH